MSKTLVLSFFFLFTAIAGNSQYKDLDGVFLGKVIALGVGGGFQSYSSNRINSTTSIAPVIYDVLINNKTILSWKLALHKKISVSYAGDDYGTPYTQVADLRFIEFEFGFHKSIIGEGLDNPTSLFVSVTGGWLFGAPKITDSQYGLDDSQLGSPAFLGAGLRLNQRLGSRLIAFAQPSYRFVVEPKTHAIYVGRHQDEYLKFSHINGQIGLMYLIGRSR